VLKAGQAVWRPAGHEHNVKNLTARPARAIAVHLDPAP
jgi:mannose-6-phosphate isomerase-like protein (cupin superfamily)